jgi:hypothetical protein
MRDLIRIHIQAAQGFLQSGVNSWSLGLAIGCMTDALRCANAARDRAMQAMCMRVINWLRAAVRGVP